MPLVGVDVWYHVGPAHEAPGRTGFAHLFEHMMFQGSKHIESDAHFKLLAGAGATGVNGTTNFDRTNYFETMPSNQLELALWLESDRMGYLLETVDQAKLSNQQDVVRNERRQSTENRPYGIVEEAMFQALFPKGHPYHGVVIGSHADIQAAKLDDVREFFRQYYAPNNATIAIAGDIDKAATKKLDREVFRLAQTRAGGSARESGDARHHRGAQARRGRSRRAATDLHGVDHAAIFQGGGRRRRHRGQHSGTGTRQPPLQEARVRKADRAERHRVSVFDDAGIGLRNRGDGETRTYAAGARRRSSTKRSSCFARRGRRPPKSIARATCWRRRSSTACSSSADSAASPTSSTCTTITSGSRTT